MRHLGFGVDIVQLDARGGESAAEEVKESSADRKGNGGADGRPKRDTDGAVVGRRLVAEIAEIIGPTR